jgi:hemerythrin-like domain-containing protein
MLLATYALLTLLIEQKEERRFIARIQNYLARFAGRPNDIDASFLESQLDKLAVLAESRHKRKLDNCVIPAVRKATDDAAPLLEVLEKLNRSGMAILRDMRESLRLATVNGTQQIAQLFSALDDYCKNLLERLAREENELLPLAQRVIPGETWFTIGTTFMAQDADRNERTGR